MELKFFSGKKNKQGSVVPKIANPRNHQGANTDEAHEGLLASSSLGPSTPNTAEQGLGPRGGF